jgi:hypothetical protein
VPDGEQPALHDLVTVLCAPDIAIGAADGQLRGEGVHGLYRNDRRTLARLEIDVVGASLLTTGSRVHSAGRTCFHGVLRADSDRSHDPSVRYIRERRLDGQCVTELWSLHNHASTPFAATVRMIASTDLAGMDAVRSGTPTEGVAPSATREGAQWRTFEVGRVDLGLSRGSDGLVVDGPQVRWSWHVAIPAGGSWELQCDVVQEVDRVDESFVPERPQRPIVLTAPESPATESSEALLLKRSLEDLDALQLVDPTRESSNFIAAGSPWYLTLFGRDSVWAARFLVPLNTELAAGTLRVLASRQGVRDDPETEEQPGRIPHEARRAAIDVGAPGARVHVPPLYYGTVDATALWVCLLNEAWSAGMSESEVDDLLPSLKAALEWIAGPGDPDGDGFCEYSGSAGAGLSNQGWKDSHDAVRWEDGTLARRPLALCEVQGYAHAAALGGAEILEAFGGDGGRWRNWARGLRERFRESFWVDDAHGRYPAIALDGDKRPVTGPASNMAHLLGTGLLSSEESGLVARQLASPSLNSGYGLRTLSTRSAGFNPLSYHCGSVWPHDTAIAVLGLAAEGHHEEAQSLAKGLLRAADSFDHRLPELFGGTDFWAGEPPVAYPAACRPQGWAAAGAVAVVGYLQGWKGLPFRHHGSVVS